MNSNYIKDYIIMGGIVLDDIPNKNINNVFKDCTKPIIHNKKIKKSHNSDIYKTELLKPKPLIRMLSTIEEIKLTKPTNPIKPTKPTQPTEPTHPRR